MAVKRKPIRLWYVAVGFTIDLETSTQSSAHNIVSRVMKKAFPILAKLLCKIDKRIVSVDYLDVDKYPSLDKEQSNDS